MFSITILAFAANSRYLANFERFSTALRKQRRRNTKADFVLEEQFINDTEWVASLDERKDYYIRINDDFLHPDEPLEPLP